jgi:3-phenylpropionate/trans-cinnamate dioxygenase ferredoxin reductase subunit
MDRTFAIVGAGLAGASAAAELRKLGFDGRIVLIGDEPERPYDRPELSKKYLRGEPGVDPFVHAPDFYGDAGIELLTGRPVEAIDVRGRGLVVGDDVLRYDRLLIATGAAPRTLKLPGADLDGVVALRTIADSDRLRQRALDARSVVVVGGGWIGSEVAASLRELGCDVTLVIPTDVPLERVLGTEIGAVYARAHLDHGVRLVTRARVAALTGAAGSITGVITDDARRIPADLVVVGIGAIPRTRLAEAAGIAVTDGIDVDERLETSVPGVFAAGDVANALHPRYGLLRVEHRDNAKRQGRHAAATMLGGSAAYDRIPFFYSDQYDIGMEYTGRATDGAQVVVRGDLETAEFIAFWLRGGRVVAGMNVNVWDVQPAIERLIGSDAVVDHDRLVDRSWSLEASAIAA